MVIGARRIAKRLQLGRLDQLAEADRPVGPEPARRVIGLARRDLRRLDQRAPRPRGRPAKREAGGGGGRLGPAAAADDQELPRGRSGCGTRARSVLEAGQDQAGDRIRPDGDDHRMAARGRRGCTGKVGATVIGLHREPGGGDGGGAQPGSVPALVGQHHRQGQRRSRISRGRRRAPAAGPGRAAAAGARAAGAAVERSETVAQSRPESGSLHSTA